MIRGPGSPVRTAILLSLCVALAGCTATVDGGDTAVGPMQASAPVPTPSPEPIPSSATSVPPSPSTSAPSTSAPSSTPVATPATPSSADPVITRIGDTQWALIEGTGTWRPECPVGRGDLRRLDVNYVDFDGVVQRGHLIVHRDSVEDVATVFVGLFDAGFPIERMESVEAFDGDVVRSLEANNTSAFNCRRPDQINAPVTDSPHANGRAIDINPYQNPWTDPRCDCWVPSADYANDRTGAGVITEGSLPWALFTELGWIWQDIKVPDYMHFDTGFPSRPR
jgi:hypothetical protein